MFLCINTCKFRYKEAINRLHNAYIKGIITTYPSTLEEAYSFFDDITIKKLRDTGRFSMATSFAQTADATKTEEINKLNPIPLKEANPRPLNATSLAQPANKNLARWNSCTPGIYHSSCINKVCAKKWHMKQSNKIFRDTANNKGEEKNKASES